MNDLNKALDDITTIRRDMARSTQFRGYGPATMGVTAGFAFLAAGAQVLWLPDPQHHLDVYLGIWIVTAVFSAVLVGRQMYTRSRRLHSGLSSEMLRMAVEQFLPSAIAGVLITMVLARYVPHVSWMLPGLWQIIFSIGIFSSCRFLPRPMIAAGAWYLLAGLSSIGLGDGRALAARVMGLSFGIGQLIVAAILLVTTLEPRDEA
jgi:hypothetical protein